MATIKVNHFAGGAALTAKQGNSGPDSLQQICEDIAADLAGLQQPALSAAASAVTAVADATVTALANATDDATVWALANDLKTKYNLAVVLINDLKSKYNTAVTLINELRTDANAAAGHTILTVVE
jgi:DNA-binding transcriptional regulator YdaS (Cro superfamily)